MTIILFMRMRVFSALSMGGALFFGFLIYIIFRKDTFLHLYFVFPDFISLSEFEFWGGDFVRYYFPDFLWEYALTSALYAIYPPCDRRKNLFVPLCAFFVGFYYEIGQKAKIFLGTGDFIDVLIYLCAAFAAYKIHLIYYKRRKNQ